MTSSARLGLSRCFRGFQVLGLPASALVKGVRGVGYRGGGVCVSSKLALFTFSRRKRLTLYLRGENRTPSRCSKVSSFIVSNRGVVVLSEGRRGAVACSRSKGDVSAFRLGCCTRTVSPVIGGAFFLCGKFSADRGLRQVGG